MLIYRLNIFIYNQAIFNVLHKYYMFFFFLFVEKFKIQNFSCILIRRDSEAY